MTAPAGQGPGVPAVDLMTPGEAAELLGISVKQLGRRADEGKVPVEPRAERGWRRYRASAVGELAGREQGTERAAEAGGYALEALIMLHSRRVLGTGEP